MSEYPGAHSGHPNGGWSPTDALDYIFKLRNATPASSLAGDVHQQDIGGVQMIASVPAVTPTADPGTATSIWKNVMTPSAGAIGGIGGVTAGIGVGHPAFVVALRAMADLEEAKMRMIGFVDAFTIVTTVSTSTGLGQSLTVTTAKNLLAEQPGGGATRTVVGAVMQAVAFGNPVVRTIGRVFFNGGGNLLRGFQSA